MGKRASDEVQAARDALQRKVIPGLVEVLSAKGKVQKPMKGETYRKHMIALFSRADHQTGITYHGSDRLPTLTGVGTKDSWQRAKRVALACGDLVDTGRRRGRTPMCRIAIGGEPKAGERPEDSRWPKAGERKQASDSRRAIAGEDSIAGEHAESKAGVDESKAGGACSSSESSKSSQNVSDTTTALPFTVLPVTALPLPSTVKSETRNSRAGAARLPNNSEALSGGKDGNVNSKVLQQGMDKMLDRYAAFIDHGGADMNVVLGDLGYRRYLADVFFGATLDDNGLFGEQASTCLPGDAKAVADDIPGYLDWLLLDESDGSLSSEAIEQATPDAVKPDTVMQPPLPASAKRECGSTEPKPFAPPQNVKEVRPAKFGSKSLTDPARDIAPNPRDFPDEKRRTLLREFYRLHPEAQQWDGIRDCILAHGQNPNTLMLPGDLTPDEREKQRAKPGHFSVFKAAEPKSIWGDAAAPGVVPFRYRQAMRTGASVGIDQGDRFSAGNPEYDPSMDW